MEIQLKDYLIIEGPKNPIFVRVTDQLPDESWRGIISAKTQAYHMESRVDFNMEDIIANLGPDPKPGEAYKCSVEPWLQHETVSPWGDVHYFVRTKEEDREKLHKALGRVEKMLRKYDFMDYFPFEIEVRHPGGIVEAKYKQSKNLDDARDLLILTPHVFADDLRFPIYRAIGSHLWKRHLGTVLQSRWIKLYHKYLSVKQFSLSAVQAVVADFIDSEMELRDFIKDLEAESENLIMMKALVDFLKKVHKIKKDDIHALIRVESSLEDYLPKSEIEVGLFENSLTKNASKSPEAFFCDSLVLYFQKESLPEEVRNLLKETLTSESSEIED